MDENNAQENAEQTPRTDEDISFDLKSLIPFIITIIVILACFFKLVLPALKPTEHAPSSILEESTGDYDFEGLFDR